MIDQSETDDCEVRYYAITAEWFSDVDMPAAPAGR
jgi:hypothetical protein